MLETFTDQARKVLQRAHQQAEWYNHRYIGTEHLLLALVKERSGVAAKVLTNLGIDSRRIRLEVEKLIRSGPTTVTMGQLPQTAGAKKVIEYAIEEARIFNHNYVDTEHLLVGLLREPDGVAGQVLRNLGLNLEGVRAEVSRLHSPNGTTPKPERQAAPDWNRPPALGASISSCPAPARLLRLLNATLPEDEQAPLMEHLDGCAGCREALEMLAAGRDSWVGMARNLRGETGPERTRFFSSAGGMSSDFLDPPAKPGQLGKLAHYEILEVIGRGGMSVVFKGFDQSLQRFVAVKVMAPELAVSANAKQRFAREAQAAAAVSHDHVVTIHAVNEFKGLPYLVMQYIHGESLQQKLDRTGPLELKEILRIGMQTADGLAAAHAQGLIHRDIKPANILLENGVQRVKITDFGLARAVDDASLTQSGVIAGTPQYMSPEQSLGEPQDYRTDLFSLGSVLYALCTGRPPFRAHNTLAVLKRVAEDTPRPIREVNPEIPDWLEAIVEKLMEKHPVERFQSAAEVARLLENHLAHLQQPGRIPRPETPPKRVVVGEKPARRPRVVLWGLVALAAMCLSCCLVPVGMIVGLYMSDEAPQQASVAKPYPFGDPFVAGKRGLRCIAISPDGRNLAAGFDDSSVLVWEVAMRKVTTLEGHKFPVTSVMFTPEGDKLLAGAANGRDDGGEVKLWDLATERVSKSYPWDKGSVHAVAISPDGMTCAAGGKSGIELWDAQTGKRRPLPPTLPGVTINAIAFSPDGQTVAAGGKTEIVYLWDPLTGNEQGTLKGHTRDIESICFYPDGLTLASGSYDGTVKLWDLSTHEPRATFEPTKNVGVRSLAIRSDGQLLAVGLSDHTVKLFDPITAEEAERVGPEQPGAEVAFTKVGDTLAMGHVGGTIRLWHVPPQPISKPGPPVPAMAVPAPAVRFPQELGNLFAGGKGDMRRVAISHDEKAVATGFGDGSVMVWNAATRKATTLEGHKLPVTSVAFTPDGKKLLTGAGNAGGVGGEVKLWDLATGKPLSVSEGHEGAVYAVAVSPDGKTLAAGFENGIELWDAENRERRPLPPMFPGVRINSITFAPDSQTIAAAGKPAIVYLWDPLTGKEKGTLKGHTGEIESIHFHPDGLTLASGGHDGKVKLWDLRTHEARSTLQATRDNWVCSVAFRGDGKVLAVGLTNQTVKLFDPATTKEPKDLLHPDDPGAEVAFPLGGEVLVTGHKAGMIRLWEVPPPFVPKAKPPQGVRLAVEPKAKFDAGKRDLLCVALSKDEKTLAAGFEDGSVMVWDVAAGKVTTLVGHKLPVRSLAFTPESKMLLTGAGELPKPKAAGELKLWNLATGKEETSYDVGDVGPVWAVAVSSDGRTIVAGGETGIKHWEVIKGIGSRPDVAVKGVRSVAFSPNGQDLAVVSDRAVVNLYETNTWNLFSRSDVHKHRSESVCYHPDGKTLAMGYGDGTVKLWDAQPKNALVSGLLNTLRISEQAAVRSLVYCRYGGKDAGGKLVLAVGLSDQTVKLIDVIDPGKPIDFPQAGEQIGSELAASAEGTYLVTGHRNGIIRLWDISGGNPAVLSAKEEAAKKEALSLQGVWEEENPTDSMVFHDNHFAITHLGDVTLAGTFEIVDVMGELKKMDLICTKGPLKGKRLRAIYKIDGDRLHLFTDDGNDARPPSFKSDEGGIYRIGKRKKS
jgi:uncharacterized protein (TIGR03067 family)